VWRKLRLSAAGVNHGRLCYAVQYILRYKIYCATILPLAKQPEPGDEKRSIERELKRGSIELIVLHLLASGEAYGYEIVSKLTAETNGALEVTDGTLYPVLYRLERAGSVTVRWETPERGVPRKYYRITDKGRGELARLTHEWTTFTKAMTRLLRQSREG
jgi:PadR family transcriptional regulator PadR